MSFLFITASCLIGVSSSLTLHPDSIGADVNDMDLCKARYGPLPDATVCDTYTNFGSNIHLDNKPTDDLNTLHNGETLTSRLTRLAGNMPTDDPRNFEPDYNPLSDAFCFNDDYRVPALSHQQQFALYLDYKTAFDEVLTPTDDVSAENNDVTMNRIPGMFHRMCFHDNAVDNKQPDFQDYAARSIDSRTKKWIGEARYMRTSGADASILICPEERYHPNQNSDQTASRVLRSIQQTLKKKHLEMSYADLLHNGCNAATLYLTRVNALDYLAINPFTFGRKDACHIDRKCKTRYPLCGPTELLPGNTMTAPEASRWFTSRGMSNCLFMALMYTHTLIDNMASMCPIARLQCVPDQLDVDAFTDKSKLYFKVGDRLDYFNFFLNKGTHKTLPDGNCEWMVNGTQVPWPMATIDCTLGLKNVEQSGQSDLANVLRNFGHNPQYSRLDILQCALNVLGGKGRKENRACDRVPINVCNSGNGHKFGGYYSTLSPPSFIQVPVDRFCNKYGYF